MVGKPAGVPHRAAAEARQARDLVAVGRPVLDRLRDLAGERRATRSSASIESTQSPVPCDSARFFCGPKPAKGWANTRAPLSVAIATVPSWLSLSTTMRSSQNATLSRQAPMFASSFLVMTIALSFTCGPRPA